MDSNLKQTVGVDLPQSSGGQGVPTPLSGAADAVGQGFDAGSAPQGQAQAVPQSPVTAQAADESATDEELDREWINRAKDIVEQTKSDPFAQSSELNRVKAEYLKARFSKELNVGNSSSQ